MDSFQQLADCLHSRGIGSFFQNPEMLVISNQNPALPSTNTFWATKKGEDWFIGTWLPAVYKVTDQKQVCAICEAVFKSSSKAIYSVAPELAARLNLRRLNDSEMEEYGF